MDGIGSYLTRSGGEGWGFKMGSRDGRAATYVVFPNKNENAFFYQGIGTPRNREPCPRRRFAPAFRKRESEALLGIH